MDLSTVLLAGSYLLDTSPSKPGSDFKAALLSRLARYHAHLDQVATTSDSNSLEDVQFETAQEALNVVELAHNCLRDDAVTAGQSSNNQTVGTKDVAQLRTLISIVFKWGIDPLLTHANAAWPSSSTPGVRTGPQVIDLTATPEACRSLSSMLARLLGILFPQISLSQTLITTNLLDRHLSELLRPCIALGWLPKSQASESVPTLDEIRPLVLHILNILPASQTIVALGAILAGTPSPPHHVLSSCASLLSMQLLRLDGVRGLCVAVFGENVELGEEAPLDKLEHVARVLIAVPAGLQRVEYFQTIIPRILDLVSSTAPPVHRKAAAFTISRLIAAEKLSHRRLFLSILLPILHNPFLQVTPDSTTSASPVSSSPTPSAGVRPVLSPIKSLSTLATLLINMDPSPVVISTLLTPLASSLYALLAYLDQVKTADPILKESLVGLLGTWGRIVDTREGVEMLWSIVDGHGGDWEMYVDGEIKRIPKAECRQAWDLVTPDDLLRANEEGDLDIESNLLDLRPDPVHFVRFLKSIDRPDLSTELFVKLLETYGKLKLQQDNDPQRTILFLQLIIRMQADSDPSSNVFHKPEHILSFVRHALQSAPAVPLKMTSNSRDSNNPFMLASLRTDVEEDEGDDSDDERSGDTSSPDVEMTETAVKLLLALLETNTDLSARTMPVLSDVFSLLEPLANDAPPSLQSLARDARLIMTARLASASAPSSSSSLKSGHKEDVQETYQKALKLLQDPMLPVRAHGLLLLRQLVSPVPSKSSDKARIDRALIPAITSIFLQSVQDDDSYMFLNAVQGLANMVDGFGKDVLKGLVNVYAKTLDEIGGSNLTQSEVDTRLRVGEALGQVIRRCGDALGIYVDILVPPLFRIVRSSHVPTTLRTSALSLLADCENTCSLSLLPYSDNLFDAMIDLLQVETVPATLLPKCPVADVDGRKEVTMEPTSQNSKSPSFRRAALHFLLLGFRARTAQLHDPAVQPFHNTSSKRARTTLIYVSSTDEDSVVRVMAREALEGLEQMEEVTVGI